MAVGLGLGAHFLVFRPLRHAAPLGKVVASLGLALYLQGVALINFGNSFPQPENIVPEETIENFLGLGKPYPGSNLYVVGFAVLMGFVLWAAYRFFRFGLATRAAAGNEKGAVLLGFSPQTLAAINWVIASVLATLSVIIVGPIAGTITPVGLTALIVPALAAALIGGLRSIPIAVAGGLALGAVQTLLDVKKGTWFTGSLEWMQTGVRNFLPLVVIIVVLYARGKSLPIRGAVEEKRLPIAPEPKRVLEHAFFWVVVLTLMAFVFEDAGGRTRFANSIQTGLVISIVMLSIVLITGYTGQISLAQMSFAGIAAFVMARMMADGIGRGSNLVPVDGPGFAWPIAGAIGDRCGGGRRRRRRVTRRANTWRAARSGDHRRRRGAPGHVLREPGDHPASSGRAGVREGSDDLRDRRRRPQRTRTEREPGLRDLRRHRAGALCDRRGQHASWREWADASSPCGPTNEPPRRQASM